MARVIKILWVVILASVVTGSAYAQSAPDLIAPNIFVRGIQLPQGVRYTASFVKPVENAALQNISVEITLPAEAQFTEMLVSRQVQFHVVRKNRQRQLTLIWQLSRLAADQPLDSFSFTVAQPLPTELEFYMQWQTAEGEQRAENFFEVPSVVVATAAQAQATIEQPGFVTLGNTGVQVSAPTGANLSAQVLPLNFNPPAQYGNIWWCSLLELTGLPPSTTAEVIMPLRRSLAPFTALQLFQQQADGSWAALAGQGVVTADGQYVIYTHPGGIVATGGPAEIQPDALAANEISVLEEPPPADNPPPAENNNPVDNAAPPLVENAAPAIITDSSSNTIIIGEVPVTAVPAVPDTPVPVTSVKNQNATFTAATLPPAAPTQAAGITDGSSNTIVIGEATSPPTATSARNANATLTVGTIAPAFTLTPAGGITDGSSNTIIISEVTATPTTSLLIVGSKPTGVVSVVPTVAATSSGITDGSSNTIVIGEATLPPTATSAKNANATLTVGTIAPAFTLTPAGGITDGSSNTIIISEVTATPTTSLLIVGSKPTGVVSVVPTVAATSSGITDGSSNTIVIGEATLPPTATSAKNANATLTVGTIAPAFTPTRGSGITDGSSNTIIIGEATVTPTIPSVIVGAKPTLQPTATVTPVVIVRPLPPVFSPVTGVVTTQPFGVGGTRVVIVTSSNTLLQCQAGQVNCSVLRRRVGAGR